MLLKQPKVMKILQNSIKSNKLSHAYLFEGHAGVGKKEIALHLVQRFFCDSPNNTEPCGECRNCKRVVSGNHPDFIFISPDGAIKIEQIRHLKKEFLFKGVEQDKKAYVLEHADKMSVQAQNALLKFIEEPETEMLFILLTENPKRIIDTIHSRCQILTFQNLSPLDLQKDLIDAGVSKGMASIISSLTQDRDEALAMSKEEWLQEAISIVTNLSEVAIKNTSLAFVEVPKRWVAHFKDREQHQLGLKLLLLFQQDLLYTKLKLNEQIKFVEYALKREELSQRSVEEINEHIKIVLEADKMLQSNTNAQMVIENIILHMGK